LKQQRKKDKKAKGRQEVGIVIRFMISCSRVHADGRGHRGCVRGGAGTRLPASATVAV
jgi:hypothetical protein